MPTSESMEDYEMQSCSDSNSDNEAEDIMAHARLLADVQGIVKKSRRRVASSSVRCASSGGSVGVDLGALATLNKELPKTVFEETAPSSKQEAKRVARKRGYEDVAEDANKWQGVVQQQRNAKQVSFPLENNSISIIKQDSMFKPLMKTELEKEMYELLSGAEMIKPKEESAVDRAMREAMTLEEVLERNKESWKLRALRDKLGKKANFRNKTKSKKFHRIQKKDRMKKQAAELESLQKSNPDKVIDKIEKLEDIRIEERMSLKHKKSKWASNLQLRAKTDKSALAALQENSRLHKDLVNKLKKKDDDDDDEGSSGSDSSDDSDAPDPEADTLNSTPAPAVEDKSYSKMKTFWGEYNRQKEEEVKHLLEENREKKKRPSKGKDQQVIEQADKIIKEKLSSTKSKKKKKLSDDNDKATPKITEYEFTFSSLDKPDNPMNEGTEQLRTLEDMANLAPDKVAPVKTANLRNLNSAPVKKSLPEVDATKIRVLETKQLQSSAVKEFFNNDSESEQEEDEDPNRDLFDDDDQALQAFNKARDEAEEAAQPKDVCRALEGWGDWAGPDIKMSEKKVKYFTEKAPVKPPSKFSDKKNVIYNEDSDMHTNIRNRMVSELPYPFLRVSDWEASIRGPTGRTFVPELVHRKLIAPPVVTELGAVIKPMDQSQLLKDKSVKEVVRNKMKKLKEKQEEGVKTKKKPRSMGTQIMDLGDSKKRKFSRKSKT